MFLFDFALRFVALCYVANAWFDVVMGGMLADPVKSYPTLFGPNSSFGGQNGVQWLMDYPYALPMFANTVFLTGCAIFVATSFQEVRSLFKREGIVADQDVYRHWRPVKENQAWELSLCDFSLARSGLSFHLPPPCTREFPSAITMKKVLC